MRDQTRLTNSVLLACLLALAVSAPQLQAGTPLTCHPFQIGNARSLPWGSTGDSRDWNAPKSDYDTRRLAEDTIGLLGEQTPVIVRMETMRRAALYGQRDPNAAADLRSRIEARALSGKSADNALYLFDYGYLLETYKQASLLQGGRKPLSPNSGKSGYAFVLEALSRRGDDPEMEFAAALIDSWPRQDGYQEHYRKALTGAAEDKLLASNMEANLK